MLHRLSLVLAGAAIVTLGLVWSSNLTPSSAGAAQQEATPQAWGAQDLAPTVITPVSTLQTCDAPGFEAAAAANGRSLATLRHSPFGRAETGWETYAPKTAAEIGTACAPSTSGFAKALSDWQQSEGIVADGVMTSTLFDRLKTSWQGERSYVALRASGVCPDAPSEASLTPLGAEEGYRGKAILLRGDVAAAYRAMVAAAKAEVPELARDPEALDVFSGFRSPAYDAARCERDGNCGGVTRAKCSAHRTGYTFDLVVGAAPGHPVDSTNDENRLHMSRSAAYRWLVANADRFGFVNYVFEPWHWEYVGAPASNDTVMVAAP